MGSQSADKAERSSSQVAGGCASSIGKPSSGVKKNAASPIRWGSGRDAATLVSDKTIDAAKNSVEEPAGRQAHDAKAVYTLRCLSQVNVLILGDQLHGLSALAPQ